MISPDPDNLLTRLRNDGVLLSAGVRAIPLTGGVSSEIHLIRDGASAFVVKSALAKLKVADDWRSDPGRNRYEQRYLSYVASFLPGAVPHILFAQEDHGYFGMEYLGEDFTNWKTALLQGDCNPRPAREAMSLLSKIHARSRGKPEVARQFDTTEIFHQLRTAPYLLTTARRHPALASLFEAEVARLEGTHECLVHGDFSPKNILFSADRLVLLDCEGAWYGDPAFDVSFLLNHLCLKGLYHAPQVGGFHELFNAAVEAYFATGQRSTADAAVLSQRCARLLLMLLLARVDGKSPVEYLRDEAKQFIREFVADVLPRFDRTLSDLSSLWFEGIAQRFGSS